MPQSGRYAPNSRTTIFSVGQMTRQYFAESFDVSTTASRLAMLRSRLKSGACGCLSRIFPSASTTTTDPEDLFRPLTFLSTRIVDELTVPQAGSGAYERKHARFVYPHANKTHD